MNDEQLQQQDKLAKDILLLSRNTLLVNLRFLDMALSQFVYVPSAHSTLLTDGRHMLYNPLHVLQCYLKEKEIPVRDYLHIVMHCIFRHMFVASDINRPLWNLSCDIAVENAITGLGLPSAAATRQYEQQKVIAELQKELKALTAEKVYHYYQERKLSEEKIAGLQSIFLADDHAIWYPDTANQFAFQSDSANEGADKKMVIKPLITSLPMRIQMLRLRQKRKVRSRKYGGIFPNIFRRSWRRSPDSKVHAPAT